MNTNIILNALIHILILILFFVCFVKNKDDSNSIIFILVVTVVFVCYLLEFVRKPEIEYGNENNSLNILKNKFNVLKNNLKKNNKINNSVDNIEHFKAPIEQKIGPYDNEIFTNANIDSIEKKYSEDCKWRKPPCNVPLYTNVGFVTPTGIESKYERLDKQSDDNNPYKLDLNLPSVTGKKEDPKAMFIFTHNQSHPDCCPSTFSTSTGCVCTTQEQRDYINKRGGNRSKDIYPAI